MPKRCSLTKRNKNSKKEELCLEHRPEASSTSTMPGTQLPLMPLPPLLLLGAHWVRAGAKPPFAGRVPLLQALEAWGPAAWDWASAAWTFNPDGCP